MKKNLLAWIQASRLPSQSYIFLPILLGQAAWVYQGGTIDWRAFLLIQLFGLFDQLYIVYANDYADYRDDCIEPEQSTRTSTNHSPPLAKE